MTEVAISCFYFQTVTEDKFDVKRCVEEAAIIVTSDKDPVTSCTITLTSPVMREANLAEGGKLGKRRNLSSWTKAVLEKNTSRLQFVDWSCENETYVFFISKLTWFRKHDHSTENLAFPILHITILAMQNSPDSIS